MPKASPFFALTLSAAFLLLPSLFSAQQSGVPGTAAASSPETVSIVVRVVNVFFNVRDHRRQFVANLAKDEFTVVEDRVPQKISYYSAEPNADLIVGLLIDNSPSQRKVLGYEQQVGDAFLRKVLEPRDTALVATVDSNVHLIQEFTHEQGKLEQALGKVKVGDETPGIKDAHAGAGQRRGTIIRDAVHMLAEQRFAAVQGRKALIVLTDGEDFGSQLDIKQAIKAAQMADMICYVLLVADPHYYYSIGYNDALKGEKEMKMLTQETGGKLVKVGAKIERLQAAFDLIATELRHHYSIGYVSSNKALDGSFRKLTIRTKHDYKIQVRQGYYATP